MQTIPFRTVFTKLTGQKKCAIEFCSLSKTAGFTGTRLGYTIVPHELVFQAKSGESISLNRLWLRRQTTKFNGVPYIIQRGAQAVFSPKGQEETKELIAYYMKNATVISNTLSKRELPISVELTLLISGCNVRKICLPGNFSMSF